MSDFLELGIVRVPNGIPQHDLTRMREVIRTHVGKRPGAVRPTGFPDVGGGIETAVATVIDELLGTWQPFKRWGAPLVTFPGPGTWDVPHAQWHLDFPVRGNELPGVRLLGIVSRLEPRGGGTLVLTGSHRLVVQGRSPDVRKALARRVPWFRDLITPGGGDRVRRFMDEGTTVDGVPLRVVELTGEAGDVFVMHPWCFHAPAPNVSDVPRMMVSQSIVPKGIGGYGGEARSADPPS